MPAREITIILLTAAGLAGAAIAAPPEGKGNDKGGSGGGGGKKDDTAFVPEILYQHNARQSQDIRLTDITGGPYVTVHSAPQAQLDGFTLSDERDQLIAFAVYGDVYLTSWTSDPVTIGSKAVISSRSSRNEGAGRVAWLQFSHDSSRLVFTESSAKPDGYSSGGARRLWIYDRLTPDGAALVLDDMVVWDVHWSPRVEEGSVLYFTGASANLEQPEHIYRYDLETGDMAPVLDYGTHFTSKWFDVTGPSAHVSPRFAVAHNADGTRERIRIYGLNGSHIQYNWIAHGDILTFDCSGTQLIHKDEGATGGGGLTITQVGGSASSFRDRKGTHSIADWMPRLDC